MTGKTAAHHGLSISCLALGTAGIGGAIYFQSHGSGYYSVGSELILYALLIATGIGLFLRWRAGIVLALAWLRAGSLAIFVVPIGVTLWMMTLRQGGSNVFQVLGGLFFAVLFLTFGSGASETSPLWVTVGVLVFLALFSYGCARLYKRLDRQEEDLLAESPTPPDARAPRARRRGLVYVLTAGIIVIALSAQRRVTVSEYELPGALQSTQFQQRMKNFADERLAHLLLYTQRALTPILQELFSDHFFSPNCSEPPVHGCAASLPERRRITHLSNVSSSGKS